MVDPKKVNLNQVPKKFADGALGGFNKDTFIMALTSGNELSPFATTPRVMKSVARWLNRQVLDYEKKYGEIDMSAPKIISPIDISELGKDDGSGGGSQKQ